MSVNLAPAKPSASVVVVRDGAQSLEVLLVRRNEKIAFHGGAWVFPGGRVDDSDGAGRASSELDLAKRAAVREALEETGLELTVDAMLPFAHWTTPVDLPKRFATWFFAAAIIGVADVRIDNSEIVDYRWMSPATALGLHVAGELNLPAPTFVTLLGFKAIDRAAALVAQLRGVAIQRFVPRLVPIDNGRCTLYEEDAGYETVDFDAPGARHRLVMKGTDWEYIRDF
ncbi:MAG: NUDIX hydrolase [Gammaproteobacteria bacterium]|nr:NUDIX hydrolase [Gammaproteobacteria bacterium]